MINSTHLAAIRNLDIAKIDPDSLIDISEVEIDTSLPTEQRIENFITQIQNPYCFLCGDTPVKIRFVSQNKTLTQSLSDYFISLK